jgi:hypothetical protein
MVFCYDVPIDKDVNCKNCIVKFMCVNEYGELAARDSEACRHLQYHYVKQLKCDNGMA